jgi:curved DNA-binding protein
VANTGGAPGDFWSFLRLNVRKRTTRAGWYCALKSRLLITKGYAPGDREDCYNSGFQGQIFAATGGADRSREQVTAAMIDYYEFLQISPHADAETIHRVYRYLASRLHPDNPDSGDAEMFRMLRAAYETLSNTSRRAEYDAMCRKEAKEEPPLSDSIDFLDSIEGEQNRRIALLAVLYYKRRANPRFPEVSLAEIERRMGFPRDYLDFTTWYLTKKGYVSRADNSDFSLTAEGVDYIESQRGNLPVLNRLLTDGTAVMAAASPRKESRNGSGGNGAGGAKKPIILPTSDAMWLDRRQGNGDRRRRAGDQHGVAQERRNGSQDRRVNTGDRRKSKQDRRSYAIMNTGTIQ